MLNYLKMPFSLFFKVLKLNVKEDYMNMLAEMTGHKKSETAGLSFFLRFFFKFKLVTFNENN